MKAMTSRLKRKLRGTSESAASSGGEEKDEKQKIKKKDRKRTVVIAGRENPDDSTDEEAQDETPRKFSWRKKHSKTDTADKDVENDAELKKIARAFKAKGRADGERPTTDENTSTGETSGAESPTGGGGDSDGDGDADGVYRGGPQKAEEVDLDRALEKVDTNKTQLMNARVRIIEANELEGNDIHPVCKVTINNKTHATAVRRATNEPKWDQELSFNLKCSVKELCDMRATFKIYSAHKLRADSFLGCHSLDLGMVFAMERHCLYNKWLVLTPDETDADVKGYLKIWLCIVLPGMIPPTYVPRGALENTQDNAIWPSTVMFKPVTMVIRIYDIEYLAVGKQTRIKKFMQYLKDTLSLSGNDLKRCDPADRVNPSVEISIGSFKMKTPIKYLQSCPQYDLEMRFPIKWPPICRSISVQVMDLSAIRSLSKVPLAYLELPMRDISRGGTSGFLPALGPCYVSLYGSFDDAKEKIRKRTNQGRYPPTAFQGRILMEIRTLEMEEDARLESYDIPAIERQQAAEYVFSKQHDHMLFCSFVSVGLIPKDFSRSRIYFQISMGHTGDVWRPRGSRISASCRTEARSPFREQDAIYYYMPWNNEKPVAMIVTKFEHQPWRFEMSNYFSNLADKVKKMAFAVRQLSGEFEPQLAAEVMKIIEEIVDHLTTFIQRHPRHDDNFDERVKVTELDYRLRRYRHACAEDILQNVFRLKDKRIKPMEALEDLEATVTRLYDLSHDPQLQAYPDIFIWMVADGKRVGYAKVSAKDVFYAPSQHCRGSRCMKTTSLVIRRADHIPNVSAGNPVIAHIHVQMFLGLICFKERLEEFLEEGSITYYTEVFENAVVGSAIGSGSVMKISDEDHTVDWEKKIPDLAKGWQERFPCPPGFQYDAPFILAPFIETWSTDPGERMNEEVYKLEEWNEEGGYWAVSSTPFVDYESNETECPKEPGAPGFVWLDNWRTERMATTDLDGWEYAISKDFGQSMNVAQHFHRFRRRLMIRTAGKRTETPVASRAVTQEGWSFGHKINGVMRERKTGKDCYKRRRWRRRMVPKDLNLQSQGEILEFDDLDRIARQFDGLDFHQHKIFVRYSQVLRWQLRAYIYQARDLIPYGRNNLPNPQVRVTFIAKSQATHCIKENINPTWDRTLVFVFSYLAGNIQTIKENPLSLAVEVWDVSESKNELMGQCFLVPQVRPESDNMQIPEKNAKLHWVTLSMNGEARGELLCAFELYQGDKKITMPQNPPLVTVDNRKAFSLPCGIKPNYTPVVIEFLCLGVRNLRKFNRTSVKSPFVEVHLGKTRKSTESIKNIKEKPNFESPYILLETQVPVDLYYMSPLTICLFDARNFGRKPLIGTCLIRDFIRYKVRDATGFSNNRNLVTETHVQRVQPMYATCPIKDDFDFDDIDWWSKFYASDPNSESPNIGSYITSGLPTLEIYEGALEEGDTYDGFNDFCQTLKFAKVKKDRKYAIEGGETVGELKANFHIYENPTPELKERLSRQQELGKKYFATVDCIVRVYIVDAKSLASQNRRGSADPYIEIKCGKERLSGRDRFVAKQLNPIFGQVYELAVQIPRDKDLVIRVRDRNSVLADDDIGETIIDLENRCLSKWRPTCGLPKQYFVGGPCQWRDCWTPTKLLEDYTERFGLPKVVFENSNTRAHLGPLEFDLDILEPPEVLVVDETGEGPLEEKRKRRPHKFLGPPKQRLALHILHYLQLVPEHVETRTLYSTHAPGLVQGHLRLWVDIFPTNEARIPPAVDISPKKPETLQLRVAIYRARHVYRPSRKLGVISADVYIKAWIQGYYGKAQTTDIHYSCADGEAEFNWRFVFDFDYLRTEECVLARRKDRLFQVAKTEEKVAPQLVVQIWDNNKMGRDKIIGEYTFNMTQFEPPEVDYEKMANATKPALPMGTKIKKCCLPCVMCCSEYDVPQPRMHYVKTDKPQISMFKTERNKGWWPMTNRSADGSHFVTGKVEMEYQMMPKEIAEENPVGKGRSKPNEDPVLQKPSRGFDHYWLFAKLNALFRYVFRKHKSTICLFVFIAVLVTMVLVLIFRWPEIVAWMFGGKKSSKSK